MSAALTSSLPAQRRGTYAFLRHARNTSHVYLTADVDVSRLRQARTASGDKLSYVSFVVKAAGDVIAQYPEAQLMLSGGFRPRLSRIDEVHAKVLFDKTVQQQRCVVAATIRDVAARSVLEVQNDINTFRDAEVGPEGPLRQVHLLNRLPLPLIHLLYRAALRMPRKRAETQGTFSVTSVGHAPLRSILPMISGTVGFGVGRATDTPVVRNGAVQIAPVLTLSLSFDHRVIDGALAAEVLAAVARQLETWEMP
ncbi:MAG TPA: 2-oxo acid dehydrogenase subunit E2 [Dermatophilaceae bacterium]|jgi:pyruvate/2-oxoglutarate dehydrogenase complex dihydrolipoamide acyltransferase (E2) component|nr:2-oxo acid dehydrogenase subunit E2 [Dermatophilaceae bacterium]